MFGASNRTRTLFALCVGGLLAFGVVAITAIIQRAVGPTVITFSITRFQEADWENHILSRHTPAEGSFYQHYSSVLPASGGETNRFV
jgi:hypothetical protein